MSQPPHDPAAGAEPEQPHAGPPPGGDPGPQPPYGQPQGGPPPSAPPPYGQPTYGQPSYGQPTYGQPTYGQPTYGQPYGQAAGPGPGYPPAPTGPFYLAYLGQEQGPLDYQQLAGMARTGSIKPDAMVRSDASPAWFPVKEVPGIYSDKEMVTTAIISWLVGIFGVDRFYLGYTGLGVAKLLTCGGLGIWAIIDLILIILRKVPDADGRPLR